MQQILICLSYSALSQHASVQKSFAEIVKGHLNPNPTSISSSRSQNTNSSSRSQNYERKFNLVIHGLKESDQGTPRSSRIKHDNELVLSTLTTVDPSVTPLCVRDCARLGKFIHSKNRPILVKLNSSNTVTTVLSSKKNLAKLDHISIQPDLNKEDQKKRAILLKERRKLIIEGIQRKNIKVKGNMLLVNGSKYGSTDGETFLPENISNTTEEKQTHCTSSDSNCSVASPTDTSISQK